MLMVQMKRVALVKINVEKGFCGFANELVLLNKWYRLYASGKK